MSYSVHCLAKNNAPHLYECMHGRCPPKQETIGVLLRTRCKRFAEERRGRLLRVDLPCAVVPDTHV